MTGKTRRDQVPKRPNTEDRFLYTQSRPDTQARGSDSQTPNEGLLFLPTFIFPTRPPHFHPPYSSYKRGSSAKPPKLAWDGAWLA